MTTPTINDLVKMKEENEMENEIIEKMESKVIEHESWCPEHWNYYYTAEGCETCNYEEEGK